MKRRKFIEITSMGSAAVAASFYIPKSQSNRKIKAGLIGAGWYGMVDLTAALKSGGVEVIAVCDVDSAHLNSCADELQKLQGTRPAVFKNYPDLLETKGLEAVFIATPPHWHALQFIAACSKGLDIYCEKPLSYDIREGEAMVKAAEKAGNIVQIGFQRRQSDAFRKTKELIALDKIGDLHQVVAQINYVPVKDDTRIQLPPASLDWEMWCGPAPKLEYRPSIGHKSWRLEKEYGNGHLVDWGIHHIDIIRKITGETMPGEYRSSGGIFALKDQITTPDTLTALMSFGKYPLTWQHRLWGTGDVNRDLNNGIFFHGEKGTLFAEDGRVRFFPAGKEGQPEDLTFQAGSMQDKHVENFLVAVRTRDKSLISCTPADAFMSTATVQLAMISYYTGTVVKWDQQLAGITDNPAASALLKREYRGNYVHP